VTHSVEFPGAQRVTAIVLFQAMGRVAAQKARWAKVKRK
jgi:hypothetical protein